MSEVELCRSTGTLSPFSNARTTWKAISRLQKRYTGRIFFFVPMTKMMLDDDLRLALLESQSWRALSARADSQGSVTLPRSFLKSSRLISPRYLLSYMAACWMYSSLSTWWTKWATSDVSSSYSLHRLATCEANVGFDGLRRQSKNLNARFSLSAFCSGSRG